MKHSNYRNVLSALTNRNSDSSLPVVALLTGLAVGAVLGVLFAPKSGEDTRNTIADKAKDLKDNAKDKLQAVKNRFHSEADDLEDLKDEVVSKVKSKVNDAKDLKDEVVADVKSKAKEVKEDVKEAADKVSKA